MPADNEMYADGYNYKISESTDSKILCGAHRPGHFDGVLTVVLKLLNLVQPDRSYFGEKDYQQLRLIENMVAALFVPTRIIACPTVREADGLAKSSRNVRLSATSRKKAALIYEYLNSNLSIDQVRNRLSEHGFIVDYASEIWGRRFVAASLDDIRLIDNVRQLP